MGTLMKCGCVAMSISWGPGDDRNKPGRLECSIHKCYEIEDNLPDLTGRKAQCMHYGRRTGSAPHSFSACDKCKTVCYHIEPSSIDLWFFKYQPGQDYDEFYCACHGTN
jgi:hypothetical protein